VRITSYKTKSKTVTKLKAKKTYYVRMRAYKTVDGVRQYGAWNAPKKAKTK
jgi:hypothetical protein